METLTMTKSIINKPTLILAAVVTLALTGLTVLSSVVAQPTAAHRDVARQMSQLAAKSFDFQALPTDAQLKELADKNAELATSPEGRYISSVQTISMILQFVASILIIIVSYRHLRTKRVAKDPVLATVLVFTVANIVSLIVSYVFNHFYIAASFNVSGLAILVFINFFLSLIFAYIIAKILDNRYVKNHSFEIE